MAFGAARRDFRTAGNDRSGAIHRCWHRAQTGSRTAPTAQQHGGGISGTTATTSAAPSDEAAPMSRRLEAVCACAENNAKGQPGSLPGRQAVPRADAQRKSGGPNSLWRSCLRLPRQPSPALLVRGGRPTLASAVGVRLTRDRPNCANPHTRNTQPSPPRKVRQVRVRHGSSS
jgi:hypothetical protein